MSEKLISLMIDEGVEITMKDYCRKKGLKIKHFIREAIVEALNSRGVKKCIKTH